MPDDKKENFIETKPFQEEKEPAPFDEGINEDESLKVKINGFPKSSKNYAKI